LLEEVTAEIPDPPVPMWRNPDTEREEPNPNDPAYLKEVARATRARGRAGLEALMMFGFELVDGLPEDTEWIRKLRFLERRGWVDLSEYDMEDPFDLEFLYKKWVAIGSDDLTLAGQKSRISQEDIATAQASFQSDKERDTD